MGQASSAVDALPTIQTDAERAVQATGTTDRLLADEGGNHHQRHCQQLGRDTLRNSALRGVGGAHADDSETAPKPTKNGPYGPLNAKRVNGFEPSTFTLATCTPPLGSSDTASTCEEHDSTPSLYPSSCNATEAELKQLIAAWPSLPEPVRAGILAMVAATTTSVGS